MSNIQIKQLNTTEDINCVRQQQIYGGERAITAEDALQHYVDGRNTLSGSTGSNVAFLYTDPDGNKFVTVVDAETKAVIGSNYI